MKLLLATTSRGKLLEQRYALEGLALDIVSLADLPAIAAPEEKGSTFLENARLKASYYHRAFGLPTVAEDAGLAIDALGGLPGVTSARWLGTETPYAQKNARILELLEGTAERDRTARYVSAVSLAVDGGIVFEHEATCEGRVATEPRGRGGFGYDPIFYYPPLSRTMAELEPDEKNRVSHRGKAMAALRAYLVRRLQRPAGGINAL
ncbi:MAG TPA: RdgB/HAM1 family non-canonical purine NTP pyrophosphatase [Vicinamibacteria bacterium]